MTDTAPSADSGETHGEAQPQAKPSVRLTLIGLAIALFGPFLSGLLIGRPLRAAGLIDSVRVRSAVGLTVEWTIAVVLVLFVLRIEHQPLSSIGFRRPRWTEIATTPLWWILATVVTYSTVRLLRDHIDSAPDRALNQLPLGVRVAMVLTAPVVEEVAFRGYLVERLGALTGRFWVAGAISAAIFAAGHMPYYGVVGGLVRLPVTIVIVVRYLRRRSLAPVIALHFMIDFPLVLAS